MPLAAALLEVDDKAAMLFFQQFIELFAAKLVMVPSLLCRDTVHDNSGKVFDTKDEVAILLSCLLCLSFRNLVGQVEVGSKTEVSVNAFQAKTTARVDVLGLHPNGVARYQGGFRPIMRWRTS